MAIDYVRLKGVAERLISSNGQPVALVRIESLDNGDGSVSNVETLHTGSGVVTGFTERDDASFPELQANDAKVICSLPVRPENGDTVTANGKTWRIVHFRDVNPADLSVIYILQVRV
jgi:hypothetical protein